MGLTVDIYGLAANGSFAAVNRLCQKFERWEFLVNSLIAGDLMGMNEG